MKATDSGIANLAPHFPAKFDAVMVHLQSYRPQNWCICLFAVAKYLEQI